MDEKVNLSYVVLIILRNRRMILVSTLITAAIAVVVSLVLPKWYRAIGSILPPESTTSQSEFVSIMRYAGFQPGMIPRLTSTSEVVAAILKSDTVTEAVIDSVGLVEAYGLRDRYKTLKRLRKHTQIDVTPEGIIRVAYEDKDRKRAADVVNSYLKALDQFNRHLLVTSASRTRQFVEKRLTETKRELETAEENLRKFEEATGAASISDQMKASIESAAELFAQLTGLEIQLARLRAYATDSNPAVRDVKSQINAVQAKLAEMGYSTATSSDSTGFFLFPRFVHVPKLAQTYGRLLREVEIKSAVYRVLSEQYEQARIEEAKNTPTIRILDWAKPPRVRSRPRRKAIVLLSTVLAFLISSFYAVRKVGSGEGLSQDQIAEEISAIIKGDFARLQRALRKQRNQ